MAIRVRVSLRPLKGKGSEALETSAIANAGYESLVPEVILPRKLARMLGFIPRLPKEARIETYVTPAGRLRMASIPNAVEVTAIGDDRKVGGVVAEVVISEKETEVLLSDRLIQELNIYLLKPGDGIWKFSDDSPEVMRRSVPPERW